MRRVNCSLRCRIAGTQNHFLLDDYVGDVEISGSTNSQSRTLTTELFTERVDKKNPNLQIELGSTICFYVGYGKDEPKEVFRGSVVNIETSNSGVTQITAKDPMFNLSKIKMSKSFWQADVYKEIKKLIKENRLEYGWFSPTLKGVKLTRHFQNTSLLEICNTLLTLASKETHKYYEFRADIQKISVQERGYDLNIQYNCKNLNDMNMKANSENIINKVVVYNAKNEIIKTEVDNELIKFYNRIAQESTLEGNATAFDKIPERGITIRGIGDITCRAGGRVRVSETLNKLVGNFYIDSEKHTFSNGLYECELELNVDNEPLKTEGGSETMDFGDKEKESSDVTQDTIIYTDPVKLDESVPSSSGGNTNFAPDTIGHNVTAEQINRLLKGKLSGTGNIFIKYCNAYKIHPALVVGVCCHESACGTSDMATDGRNNFFGILGYRYNSVDEGIKAGVSLLSRQYVYKRKFKRLQQFVGVY